MTKACELITVRTIQAVQYGPLLFLLLFHIFLCNVVRVDRWLKYSPILLIIIISC
ncbi:hypothetical protein I3843_15G007400 [Carya illinoinensis]|uniref:Uncharacterized protein n=1 Tax=Carya illinoinensis TaxID=32201 RepID=A0A922A2B5_CARIL|nr:hypothetical protein I3760_15G007700 [Carya illinoinensis]KAG6673778.1 hypothetical protein I3842_15G008100 [Carya illinoinensis]KAG7942845.1 hypothetical protein I3843_15G007400 [Carya illinoinensis]